MFVKNPQSDDMINREKGTSDVGRQVVISPYASWGGGVVGGGSV